MALLLQATSSHAKEISHIYVPNLYDIFTQSLIRHKYISEQIRLFYLTV